MTLGRFSDGLRTVPHGFKLVYGDFSRFISINESVKNKKGISILFYCSSVKIVENRKKPSVITCKSSQSASSSTKIVFDFAV